MRGVRLVEIADELGIRRERVRNYLHYYARLKGYDVVDWRDSRRQYILPREIARDFKRFVEKHERDGRIILIGTRDGGFKVVRS